MSKPVTDPDVNASTNATNATNQGIHNENASHNATSIDGRNVIQASETNEVSTTQSFKTILTEFRSSTLCKVLNIGLLSGTTPGRIDNQEI